MKKATNLISFLILMMVLVGCSKETVHIDFPFEVGDVENVEMYTMREHRYQQKRKWSLQKLI